MAELDPNKLMDCAAELIGSGRPRAARPLIMAAQELAGRVPRIAELFAVSDMNEGNLEQARTDLDEDVVRWPEHAGLRKLRAQVRIRSSDLPGALSDAAEGVILAPGDAVAKALLGMLLLEAGQWADASACLRDALHDLPDQPSFIQALAVAENALGQPENAAAVLQSGIDAAPKDVGLRKAAVFLAIQRKDFAAAAAQADSARRHGVIDACVFGLLGHALSSLGRHAEAQDAYQEALKLGPEDPYVRHLVASSGMVASAPRAPDDYVRAVFDGYAARFDAHLIGLGYRGPGLIRAAVLRRWPSVVRGQAIGPVLDLGCGTGLVGVALSDLTLRGLVGVDLSPRMLECAREKEIYSDLHESEIGEFLQRCSYSFPLIIAADVFCYFGDISEILAAVAARLTGGGVCIFSVEELTAADADVAWNLGRQGRFAHRRDYVEASATAAGLKVIELRPEVLRQEADSGVAGLIVVLERLS